MTRPSVHVSVPRGTIERLCRHLDAAYEAISYMADIGRVDFSTAGEPIVEALRIARAMRDEARSIAQRLAA